MSVIGVDPGSGGALALYDAKNDALDITDMPTATVTIGKSRRMRIDAVSLLEYFEVAKLMGAELVIIEAVGGRPGQSGMNAFTFGYGVGLIYMAAIAARIPIESVPAGTWKRLLKVPGKKNSAPGDIVLRADEMFPNHRALWRGVKGGLKVDRAEASMLAWYGVEYALRAPYVKNIDEWTHRYRHEDETAP